MNIFCCSSGVNTVIWIVDLMIGFRFIFLRLQRWRLPRRSFGREMKFLIASFPATYHTVVSLVWCRLRWSRKSRERHAAGRLEAVRWGVGCLTCRRPCPPTPVLSVAASEPSVCFSPQTPTEASGCEAGVSLSDEFPGIRKRSGLECCHFSSQQPGRGSLIIPEEPRQYPWCNWGLWDRPRPLAREAASPRC